jgi:hypothetical protein|tara:strand:- start:1273 stop:1512 length:240 start_codon:yes stop_codon:yes gene_type:complete
MSRSNQIDATAWRNVIEFERLATIYLGFFKDTTQASQEVQKHKDEHRAAQEEGMRLADLKKSHDEWIDSYMENIANKQK